MKLRSHRDTSAYPGLRDLPPELRLRILSHLFSSYIPKKPKNPQSKALPSKYPARPNFWDTQEDKSHPWLQTFRFYIDQDRVTKTRTARSHFYHKAQKRKKWPRYEGVFLTSKTLRGEALDVWYEFVRFEFVENEFYSRRMRDLAIPPRIKGGGRGYGRADGIVSLDDDDTKSGGASSPSFLKRVRNCGLVFDINDGDELEKLPGRLLLLLMKNLNVRKMKTFKIALNFRTVRFPQPIGMKNWYYPPRGAVEEQVWERVLGQLEGLDLRGKGAGVVVKVDMGWGSGDSWGEKEEWARFEEVGRVVGGEVTGSAMR